jgi:GT2 family glycosyltransferase
LKYWYKECNAANEPGPVKAVPSGFWVVKRSVFKEVEGFSPEYSPALLEDLDFCLKIREKDYAVYYLPQYEITHVTKVSVNDTYLDMNRIGNGNLQKIVNRWNNTEVFEFEVGM